MNAHLFRPMRWGLPDVDRGDSKKRAFINISRVGALFRGISAIFSSSWIADIDFVFLNTFQYVQELISIVGKPYD